MCARGPPGTEVAESSLLRSARRSARGANHRVAAIKPTIGLAPTV